MAYKNKSKSKKQPSGVTHIKRRNLNTDKAVLDYIDRSGIIEAAKARCKEMGIEFILKPEQINKILGKRVINN